MAFLQPAGLLLLSLRERERVVCNANAHLKEPKRNNSRSACFMTLHQALRLIYVTLSLLHLKLAPAEATFVWRRFGARATGSVRKILHDSVPQHDAGEHATGVASNLRGGGLEGGDRRSHSDTGYSGQTTWIQNFCRTPGNEFFAEV